MKKILLAIIVMLTLGSASAQITIEKKDKSYTTVCRGFFGYNELLKFQVEGVDYYMLSLTSDNRYDSPYSIRLGNKKETIDSLTLLYDTFAKDQDYDIKDTSDKVYRFHCDTSAGEKRYMVKTEGYAGWGYFRLTEIKKFLAVLTAE